MVKDNPRLPPFAVKDRIQPDLYIPSDGEICGLSMGDIQGNTIHVHHSLVLGTDKEWHLKAPKTETSDRYIEAPDFVADRNNINHFRFHDLRHYSASIRHAFGYRTLTSWQTGAGVLIRF